MTSGLAQKCLAPIGGPIRSPRRPSRRWSRPMPPRTPPRRLRANLFSPGATRTEMRAQAMPGEDPLTLPSAEDVAAQIVPMCLPSFTDTGAVYKYAPRGLSKGLAMNDQQIVEALRRGAALGRKATALSRARNPPAWRMLSPSSARCATGLAGIRPAGKSAAPAKRRRRRSKPTGRFPGPVYRETALPLGRQCRNPGQQFAHHRTRNRLHPGPRSAGRAEGSYSVDEVLAAVATRPSLDRDRQSATAQGLRRQPSNGMSPMAASTMRWCWARR